MVLPQKPKQRAGKKKKEVGGIGNCELSWTPKRTFIVDDQVDLAVLLQVLSRLEALRALSIVLSLVHLVDSVEDDSRSSESNASTADGNANVTLHGIASRDSSVGGILADRDVRDATAFQGLKRKAKKNKTTFERKDVG